ncbi:MAG: FAD-dependent oxidoreductase [Planctomycetota bacterium]
MNADVGIVGGGIAGLAAARELRAAGRSVVVFDKGRAAGGRCATRRAAPYTFDHGAQFFTVREPAFAQALAPFGDRLVQRWAGPFRTWQDGVLGPDPRPGERYVAVPGMSALARALAEPLGDVVQPGLRVEALRCDGDGHWLSVRRLADDVVFVCGPFPALVVALPPPQARGLLATAGLEGPVVQRLDELATSLQPCLAAMVAFCDGVPGGDGAWFVTDEVLGFAAHDGGKPGRSGEPTYVLHGTAPWSLAQFDQPLEASFAALLAAFARVVGGPLPEVVHRGMHRWRYALASPPPAGEAAVFDRELQLAAAGDAFVGGRVEGAFSSGVAAARLVLSG